MDADMLRPQELSEAVIASEDCSKAIFITMASINAIEMRLSQSHSQAIAHNHIVLSLSTRVADGKAMLLAGIRLLYQWTNIEAARISGLEQSSQVPMGQPTLYAQPINQDDVVNVKARVDNVEIELSHLVASTDEWAIKLYPWDFVGRKNRHLG
jgi:hypothetical protein